MSIKYTNIFHCQDPPKFKQNWDFWSENIPSGNPATQAGARTHCRTRAQRHLFKRGQHLLRDVDGKGEPQPHLRPLQRDLALQLADRLQGLLNSSRFSLNRFNKFSIIKSTFKFCPKFQDPILRRQ
jgi:hypothetical protein